MAYQDWLNRAASTSAVSNTLPPALIPATSSVLDTQPVPSTYTGSRQTGGNTNISNMPQINQIMGLGNTGINTPTFPGTGSSYIGGSGAGGNAPSSWSGYSTGGSTGATNPSTGTGNPGVTQTYSGNWQNTESPNYSVPYSATPNLTSPLAGGSVTSGVSWGPATPEDHLYATLEHFNTFGLPGLAGTAGMSGGTQGLGTVSFQDSPLGQGLESVADFMLPNWAQNLFNRN